MRTRLLSLSYPAGGTGAVLIYFAIDDVDSLENVQERMGIAGGLDWLAELTTHNLNLQWISEVQHFCHGLPLLLVGCRQDLSQEPANREFHLMTPSQGDHGSVHNFVSFQFVRYRAALL